MIDNKNIYPFSEKLKPDPLCEVFPSDLDRIITVVHFTNLGYSAFHDNIAIRVFRVKKSKFLFTLFFQYPYS